MVVALLLTSGFASAQWYKQDVSTVNDLNDVHFADSQNGWVVGVKGTILHTTNAGITWEKQTTGDTVYPLQGVYALTTRKCWIVSDQTHVYKTTDGGSTWLPESLDVPFFGGWVARGVVFADSLSGWISGAYYTATSDSSFVLKTADGGITWNKQYLEEGCIPHILDALDDTHVWLTCDNNLARTTDGISWKSIAVVPADDALSDVCFVTPSIGWITEYVDPGTSFIYRSDDSGRTGQIQHSFSITGSSIYTSFVDTLHGWVVQYTGFRDGLEIWNSSDGGASWGRQFGHPVDSEYGLPSRMMFTDSLHGTVVGQRGMVLHTDNGGITSVDVYDRARPEEYSLAQNYPNPFNPSTTISYTLPAQSHVTLKVFNVLGQEIATLVNGIESPGSKSVKFDGSKLSSGVYFYKLQAGNYSAVQKLMLLK